jgi:alanine racemase
MNVSPTSASFILKAREKGSIHHDTTWAEIGLDALGRNYDFIRERAGAGRHIIVPVKANGYGHGATAVAQYLADRGAYAVQTACVREAVEIRQSGNTVKLIAYPTNLRDELHLLLQHGIVPTVTDFQAAQFVSDTTANVTSLYVKVDAGLQRLGVPLQEAEDVILKIAALPKVTVEGLYTHVPFSDMSDAPWAESRIRAFEELVDALKRRGLDLQVTQARASAHLIASMNDTLTAVCAGHLLYGLSPLSGEGTPHVPVSPVLRAVRTRVIQVRPVVRTQAEALSNPYGGNFKNVECTGVLPVGKVNGMRRPVPGAGACVLVAGRPAPILSVTLEYTVIDLTGHRDVFAGDMVTILGVDSGATLHLADVAAHAGCSPLDICIGFHDMPFHYAFAT